MFRSCTRIIIRLHVKTIRKKAKNVYVAHDIMRSHNLYSSKIRKFSAVELRPLACSDCWFLSVLCVVRLKSV